jgi:hypothetical protein
VAVESCAVNLGLNFRLQQPNEFLAVCLQKHGFPVPALLDGCELGIR